MELEEMKTLWDNMSAELEKQKKMNSNLIIKMTKANYRNKMGKIILPEAIGSLGCMAVIVYILANFQKLGPWYLVVCGVVAALILLILPLLSLWGIYKMHSVDISGSSYKQSIQEFSKAKMKFIFAQKMTFYLAPLLMLAILPVMGMLMGGKNFFTQTNIWLWYAISFPFFYPFTKWVYRHYVKATTGMENLLKELED
jgi:hypothetical protein